MTTRIVTDANGRKHITNEPFLHPPKRNVACPCGTATPREWVGLTDEERKEIHDTWRHKACLTAWGYEEAIEAKLKAKNFA